MKKITVLGCGLVGRTIAENLAADGKYAVSVADISEKNLGAVAAGAKVEKRVVDLSSSSAIGKAIADADVVAGALPSALGFMALRTVIEARKPYSDISFMAEDAMELDGLAKQHGVTAIVDCGVAPGLANLIIGDCAGRLSRLDEVTYYVGGLPKVRTWPYQYKAPFAPLDVLEEYTRPARMIYDGRLVVREALSEPELVDFAGIGTLEAFNTDGLRSLLVTVAAKNMKEKTLRYPGHIELMRVLRETGYFKKDEITLRNGTKVRPIDVTSQLMFPMWELRRGEQEFTVLRVIVEGQEQGAASGQRRRYTYDLLDETNAETGHSSMARTTGYPCAVVARMLAEGVLNKPGVSPPELLGKDGTTMGVMERELERWGIVIKKNVEELGH
jgi:lysine 6-dehydrogenase